MTGARETGSLEQRVTELEVRLAFQERTLSELDGVTRDFAERVSALQRELAELVGVLRSVVGAVELSRGDPAAGDPDLDG